MSKRIVALFLAFVTLFWAVPFASADYVSTPVNFWEKLWTNTAVATDSVEFVGSILTLCGGIVAPNSVCAASSDQHHHADTVDTHDFKVDGDNYSYAAICEYCGNKFYVTSSDFSASYNQYVNTLPATGYDSTGGLIWKPTFNDLSGSFYAMRPYTSSSYIAVPFETYEFTNTSEGWVIFTPSADGRSVSVFGKITGTTGYYCKVLLGHIGFEAQEFVAPVAGIYYLQSGPSVSYSYVDKYNMDLGQQYISLDCDSSSSPLVASEAGGTLTTVKTYEKLDSYVCCSFLSGKQYFPTFRIVPLVYDDGPDYSITYYDNSTRVGNIIFDYGVKNEDNSITNVTNNYIVNETNNTYTNPVTGVETPIVNWTYDYGDRSYNLTVEGGDTINVTYGDEYVTIDESVTTIDNSTGDTVTTTNNYTVYYVVNNYDSGNNSGDYDSGDDDSGSTTTSASRVFRNYGATITQHYGNDGHNGVDVVPTSGYPDVVTAHSQGTVAWTQTGQENNQGSTGNESYGNAVKILHPNGYYTLYAHLASVYVVEGDMVVLGQAIGYMGNTGNSYGAHLHFEVRDDTNSVIDPEPYLTADLPGLETDSGGWSWWKQAWTDFCSWWKDAWADFRSWFSGSGGNYVYIVGGDTTIFAPGVDGGGDDEGSSWSFLDLLKAVVDGTWTFIKGVPGAIFGGLSGFVDGFLSIGDFFDAFDSDNSDGVFGVLTTGGSEIWE